MGYLKGKSSLIIFDRHANLKYKYGSRNFWARGYYVTTIGNVNEETVKEYIKEKYQKPGNVFLGVVHRLDRPVSGLVVFARTSKALTRLNEMFRTKDVHKTYWAIVANRPNVDAGELSHWLVRNEKQNKSYAYEQEKPNSKKVVLGYQVIGKSDRYYLLEVDLKTGRHHQIRC
jgi:23S rRNA pseudouridine1911/1915/1917 synthase